MGRGFPSTPGPEECGDMSGKKGAERRMLFESQPTRNGMLWKEVEESSERRRDTFSASLDVRTLLEEFVA